MRGLLRRLAIIASASMLAAGLGTGVTALSAAPAFASTGPCADGTNAQPTAAHVEPSDTSTTEEYLNSGVQVTGNCSYWDNVSEGMWYMAINWTEGRTLYVWVQRLDFGSVHECLDNGNVYSIGSEQCLLHNAS